VSKTPVKMKAVDIAKTKNFNFFSPFDKNITLLPAERQIALEKLDGQWKLTFDFQKL